MRTDVEIQLSPEDRVRLEKLVAAPVTAQKHVWRAQIVLLIRTYGVSTLVTVDFATQSSAGCVIPGSLGWINQVARIGCTDLEEAE